MHKQPETVIPRPEPGTQARPLVAASGGSDQAPDPLRLGAAILRYWWAVLLPAILLTGAGIAVGLQRAPTYSAKSELTIGRADLQTQSLPGFVQGATALAASYSRILESQQLVARVSRRTGQPASEVRERLTATALPDSPMFAIKGTGPSPRAATTLAKAATAEMVRYITSANSGSAEAASVLSRFRSASRQATDLQSRIDRLRALPSSPNTAVQQSRDRRVNDLRVQQSEAELQSDTLKALYQNARETNANAARIQVLSAPLTASSDRSSMTQRLAFVGLVGGSLVGVAFAAGLAARRRRRWGNRPVP
jgi:hypothetical protein